MHDFKNQRVQNLYDYLVNDFTENDYMYSEDYVLESFGDVVDDLFEKDWLYFEAHISSWDSVILERLARLIVVCNSKKLDYDYRIRVYCLAVINCWDEETCDLCDNLMALLGNDIDLDIALFKKLIDRLEQLINHYTVVAKRQGEIYIIGIINELKEKLREKQA